MTQLYDEFMQTIKNNKYLDMNRIVLAFDFAYEAHLTQYRKSGAQYITHPIEVAKILATLNMDTDTIITGLIHDVVEDTMITIADIKYNFGDEVARLVEGVTKLDKLPFGQDKASENIKKMIIAMAKDIRVVIIKLADRLHNMRTLKHMPDDKKMRISQETLKIYAPLAHRLGMSKIKSELEDLAFYNTQPDIYKEIAKLVNQKKSVREENTQETIHSLNEEFVKYGLKASIIGRAKHLYSIYQKMFVKNKNFDEIYDLLALRIICNTDVECYNILGIVHNLWKPVPGRFKDYIAMPKSNGYQSIHTAVFTQTQEFIEVQIRTTEMDIIAEDGVAAHWTYKERKGSDVKNANDIYSWMKNILEWQHESDTTEEFIQSVTNDIVFEEVFVFTPKGDVVNLKTGSTPLDFAFTVHTEVGYKCIGAKINDKIVPLNTKLKNGDKLDIITSKTARGPSRDWLDIVVTTGAKQKIKRWFKSINFEELVEKGKEILEKELKVKNVQEFLAGHDMEKFLKRHSIQTNDEFLFRIGSHKLDVHSLEGRLIAHSEMLLEPITQEKVVENIKNISITNSDKKKALPKSSTNVIIEGTLSNTEVQFAKCCTPLPGDEIEGYISRLKGIVVHRTSCQNFLDLKLKSPDKVVTACWNLDFKTQKFNFRIHIKALNKPLVIQKIVSIISEYKLNITDIHVNSTMENGKLISDIFMVIDIENKAQGENIVNKISALEEILSVKR
ncbi:MAG: bifunctional (p)ppGpp synthetase/guanosine-3',5'-bis(diphosphate) 3'-pyrophosphohydrolase [Fusobacteria bacterium]|nr:bifunctional (p)ppGpp synthetase/guanosine-3',5'-bis(diphosphate) 3'-pyrophosphohydrolase [Fusobacteriota bacterium]